MTSARPAISVAIRAFRRETVPAAIESVLRQTHTDLELVVYDDARTLEDLVAAVDDPRVRYHRATEKLDASGRFLAALAHCRGELVALLDDDDRYEPTFLEQLLPRFDDPTVGFAFCRAQWEVDGALEATKDALPGGRQGDAAADLVGMRYTVPPSRMVLRRAAIDDALAGNPMPDGVWPDVFVTTRVAATGWAVEHVPVPLVTCGWHAGQVSRARGTHDMAIATWRALRFDDPRIDELRRETLARALVGRAAHHVARGDRRAAAADLDEAAALAPRQRQRARRALTAATKLGPPAQSATRSFLARRDRVRRPPAQR